MNFAIFSLNVEIVTSKISYRVIKITLLQLTENSVAEVFQGLQNGVCNDISAYAILSDSHASGHYDRLMYMKGVVMLQTTIANLIFTNPFLVELSKFSAFEKIYILYFYHYIYCRLLSRYH